MHGDTLDSQPMKGELVMKGTERGISNFDLYNLEKQVKSETCILCYVSLPEVCLIKI
jgi:hypothetical protein